MARSSLSALAKGTLWGLLGEQYPAEGETTAKKLAAVPKAVRACGRGQMRLLPAAKPAAGRLWTSSCCPCPLAAHLPRSSVHPSDRPKSETPMQDRWEACCLSNKTRKLREYVPAKQLAAQYEEVGGA